MERDWAGLFEKQETNLAGMENEKGDQSKADLWIILNEKLK